MTHEGSHVKILDDICIPCDLVQYLSFLEMPNIESFKNLRKFKKNKPEPDLPPNFWIIFISLLQEVKKKNKTVTPTSAPGKEPI